MKKFIPYVTATLVLFLQFALNIQAQPESVARTAIAAAPSATPVPSPTVAPSDQTERERILLDRINKLERRLTEVESRTTAKPADNSAVPVSPNTPPPDTAQSPSANSSKAKSAQTDSPTQTASDGKQDKPKKEEPFAFADWSWLSGNARTKELAVDTPFFTPEVRFDVNYTSSFNHPQDNTIGGSSEIFRSGEVQLTQIGVGGDFHYNNVRGRLMTQFGMYSQTTPRNDASPGRGQWNLDNAYRYISEAYGGYHWNKMHGINVDAGIFMSYIGLWSYYNFDNWTYQPSYVSSNTPWFFNGLRIQFFPTKKLKIEPWIVNGWQSYGKFNRAPGVGAQILYRPNSKTSIVLNNYFGTDTLGNKDRKRFHTDDSIQYKYYDNPNNTISKAAFTFTFDAGCEYGGGVSCSGKPGAAAPGQYFLGFMAYNRLWFKKDKFALTLGGGAISNPGRYLVLLPPINGATAFSGTPYFTANPGDPYKAYDASATFDYMPSQYITFRAEYNQRGANVPYFSGKGGVTPPGGNSGAPGSFVQGWSPDLVKQERRYTIAILVKY